MFILCEIHCYLCPPKSWHDNSFLGSVFDLTLWIWTKFLSTSFFVLDQKILQLLLPNQSAKYFKCSIFFIYSLSKKIVCSQKKIWTWSKLFWTSRWISLGMHNFSFWPKLDGFKTILDLFKTILDQFKTFLDLGEWRYISVV